MKIYRQGDVLIRQIKSIPTETTVRKNGILAYGEVTGHAHKVEELTKAEVLEVGNDLLSSRRRRRCANCSRRTQPNYTSRW